MPNKIEFLFDFGSPTAYLAYRRLPGVMERTGAEVEPIPILLGGVFKATGNSPPGAVAAKGRYMGVDMARFAKRHGIRLAMNPDFPINTLTMMRGAAGLQHDPRLIRYMETLFAAMWERPRNLGDPAQLATALEAGGFDAEEIAALSNSDEAKARLKANTEQAVERGVFGAPTFFVGDEMFFGQDRLDYVEETLAG